MVIYTNYLAAGFFSKPRIAEKLPNWLALGKRKPYWAGDSIPRPIACSSELLPMLGLSVFSGPGQTIAVVGGSGRVDRRPVRQSERAKICSHRCTERNVRSGNRKRKCANSRLRKRTGLAPYCENTIGMKGFRYLEFLARRWPKKLS
jgi:hypothetical protein